MYQHRSDIIELNIKYRTRRIRLETERVLIIKDFTL